MAGEGKQSLRSRIKNRWRVPQRYRTPLVTLRVTKRSGPRKPKSPSPLSVRRRKRNGPTANPHPARAGALTRAARRVKRTVRRVTGAVRRLASAGGSRRARRPGGRATA